MTAMLQAMKHRGPDSTGYALYRPDSEGYVMHVKLAEANGNQDFELADRLDRQRVRHRGPHDGFGGHGHQRSTPPPATTR